jgi:hypothetical protein
MLQRSQHTQAPATKTHDFAFAIIGCGCGKDTNPIRDMTIRFANAVEHFDPLGGIKPLIGSWRGKKELALMVPVPSDAILAKVKSWANDNNQEAILLLSEPASAWHGREATLFDLFENTSRKLGEFKAVTRDVALAQEAWTLDFLNPDIDTREGAMFVAGLT